METADMQASSQIISARKAPDLGHHSILPITASPEHASQAAEFRQDAASPWTAVTCWPAAAVAARAGQGLESSTIIPLPAQLAPHSQPSEQQLPASPTDIKARKLAPREAVGGDPGSPFPPNPQPSSTMIFSDLYRSPRSPFSKLRASHPHGVTLPPDIDADLVSKDKARQKEAVRRLLSERIRNDWDFVWPPPPTESYPDPAHAPLDCAEAAAAPDGARPEVAGGFRCAPGVTLLEEDATRDPGEEADSESDAESVYSTVSEDPVRFRPRAEWISDLSDDDEPRAEAASPFRFDSPDAVGTAVNISVMERRARRRRAVRDEVAWNPGLACFEARRNAWTGAKTVRVKPKPPTPVSPTSPRRLFWRSHHRSGSTVSSHAVISPGSPPATSSALSPAATNTTQQTDAGSQRASSHETSSSSSKGGPDAGMQRTSSQDSSRSLYAVETLVPIPPPLLPPQNPMRASVTPSIYPSLYDKIVVHNLQPSCPVNLSDMIRACVVGWKRDGEWPPRPAVAAPVYTASELAAIRHRKAVEAQQRHARKASTATNGSSRRLSFGFLSGNRASEDKDKDPKGDGGSDEGTGRAIRRSLQKVFSLGQHSHSSTVAASPPSPTNVNAATVPTKEVTAAV